MSPFRTLRISFQQVLRKRVRRGAASAQDTSSATWPVTCFHHICANRHVFVHSGNLVLLVAVNQTDMLNLRALSIVASMCGMAYNLLQPTPLIAPACWGVFFISCHAYYIVELLRERQKIVLSEEDETAYELAFMKFGFTPRNFLDIMEGAHAKWRTSGKGEFVHKRGEPMDDISYLVEGQVQLVSSTGDPMFRTDPGKGGWLGEFFDPNMDIQDYWSRAHHFPISFQCVSERCRTLCFARRPLQEILASSPRLTEAAARSQVSDLWGKLHKSLPESRRRAYDAMLEVCLIDEQVDKREAELLVDFRRRHNITDEEHIHFLAGHGWSVEEFERGRRWKTRKR